MKTSEVLRSAVDNHLAINKHDYDSETHSEWLCWCIIQELLGVERRGIGYHVQKLPKKFQELCSIMTSDVKSHASCDIIPWFEKPNSQEVRFMYAEFLALYFEDMGD